MNRYLIVALSACALNWGCNSAELEQLRATNEKLTTENRSLKSSLNNAQQKLERLDEIEKRMGFLVGQLQNVKIRIVTNYGDIDVKLHPENAPLHCLNFANRAEAGFYDGTLFHRVIKGFMIQGGDPNSKDKDPYNDGSGGPLVMIPHEFNDTKHLPGVLSMARVSDVSQGAGSQFFIMLAPKPHLDGQYTAFGEVSKGMDVVNKIANVEIQQTDPRLPDRPKKPVLIRRMEVSR